MSDAQCELDEDFVDFIVGDELEEEDIEEPEEDYEAEDT
jgi:hypothetical protein